MAENDLVTGEKARISGYYKYSGSPTGKIGCSPTPEEQIIPLEKGETAPPVKSCQEPAKWKFARSK